MDDLADEPNSIYDFQPSHITRLLASYGIDWQAALKEYFTTIHDWFSLVRHDKFDSFYHISSFTDDYNGLPIPKSCKDVGPRVSSADAALLYLCLYLVTQVASSRMPHTEIFCRLYRIMKRIFAIIKCLTKPTVELIQCGAFIALFEYGHGDTISAYQTLSETVALARVYGLSPSKYRKDNGEAPTTYEEEEQRSIWWCLFILDQ